MGAKTVFRKIYRFFPFGISNIVNKIKFRIYGVSYGKGLITNGRVWIKTRDHVKLNSACNISIGSNVQINSSLWANPSSHATRTILYPIEDGKISVGNNVGISNSILIANRAITIEDDVMIGAGCIISDTDWHSVRFSERISGDVGIAMKPIVIKKGAWLGGDVTILKGVSVGEYSVIGAGSVVTKNVPPRQIWAGNPAIFIRDIEDS